MFFLSELFLFDLEHSVRWRFILIIFKVLITQWSFHGILLTEKLILKEDHMPITLVFFKKNVLHNDSYIVAFKYNQQLIDIILCLFYKMCLTN